ncbi:MAG: DUF11 domain-containing protein, partial [Verrucomicrobiota bacterium]
GNANIMINDVGGPDSWNVPSNWSLGHVPSGPENVIIGPGRVASVQNPGTPAYTGTLTVRSNATLRILNFEASRNAIEGASSITFEDGAIFEENIGANLNLASVMLAGENTLFSSLFGASDWQTTTFTGPIDGDRTMTFLGFNGHQYHLNAPNSFTQLVANAIDRYIIEANAPGSLGTGDVIINPRVTVEGRRSAVLIINAPDAMSDTGRLFLNGNGWDFSLLGPFSGFATRLVMNADDTISELWINGMRAASGTWGSSASGADNVNDTIFSGTGILTVGGSLMVTKTAPPTVFPGSMFTYTIDVLNLYTGDLSGITVTDALPNGVEFVASTPPAVSTNGNAFTFDIGTLETMSNVVITIDVTVT